jgi:hypothetical protein
MSLILANKSVHLDVNMNDKRFFCIHILSFIGQLPSLLQFPGRKSNAVRQRPFG